MTTIHLELDDSVIAALHQSNQTADRAAKEIIAMELYRRGTISSGKAAEVLGVSRWEFIALASKSGIPFFDMTEDEWETERARSESL